MFTIVYHNEDEDEEEEDVHLGSKCTSCRQQLINLTACQLNSTKLCTSHIKLKRQEFVYCWN